MQTITTVTQKGQITLSKSIRKKLHIKPTDRVVIDVRGNSFVGKRVPSIEEAFGMLYVPGRKPVTDEEMKKAVEEGHLEHYRKKTAREFTPKAVNK